MIEITYDYPSTDKVLITIPSLRVFRMEIPEEFISNGIIDIPSFMAWYRTS